MKKIFSAFFGILIGLINGTIGAGGGLIAVPMLKSGGLTQKESHSSAIAVLLPVSIVSAITYLSAGHVSLSDATPFILPSVGGAIMGTVLLHKIPTRLLKKIFAGFMIYAGVRLFLR